MFKQKIDSTGSANKAGDVDKLLQTIVACSLEATDTNIAVCFITDRPSYEAYASEFTNKLRLNNCLQSNMVMTIVAPLVNGQEGFVELANSGHVPTEVLEFEDCCSED
jgi:hypothetical protein